MLLAGDGAETPGDGVCAVADKAKSTSIASIARDFIGFLSLPPFSLSRGTNV